MTILSIVENYIDRGWSPIPVPFREKGPKLKEWQALRITSESYRSFFRPAEQNVGILLGEPSGGLTDIDLDCREALVLLRANPKFLPPTKAAFGRRSKPRSHYLYRTGIKNRITFIDPNAPEQEAMLIEIRANGQTVFPGSVHVSGQPVEWDEQGEPTPTDDDGLTVPVSRLAAACLLLRYWPQKGSELRHLAAGALGGFFGRIGGKSAEHAPALVRLIAELAGDDEVADRVRAAEDAITNLDKPGAKVPGLPKMREIFGDKVANQIAEWFGVSTQSLLEEMNAEYFVIELGGKVVVGTFKADATGGKNLVHYSFEAFKNLHDHIPVGGGKGKPIGKGSWWLKQRDRRQYKGIDFKAGPKGAVTDTSPLLNLWQGFGAKPVQGDWELMRSHIHAVLASNNDIHASYITRWLAWAVQNPSQRAEVMLILKSEEEGSGKGALANQMVEIFGMGIHGVRIDKPKQLTGDFNAHLQRASLVYVDEGHWPGNKADEGAYKGIITEPYFAVQPKGIDIYFVPNCSHIICTSNNDWVAPAGPTARRLAISRVSPQRVGDRAYFKALFDQMNNGGREAMLYDLLNMELGDWHPRNDIPQTDELMEQKLRSTDSELAWFIDLLNAGRLPGSGNKYVSLNECPAEWIFDAYTQHAGKTGKYHKSVSTMLGMKLRKWLKDCKPYFRNREGSYPRGEDGGTKRGTIYQFPPLDECRKAIGKHLNGFIPWHGPEEWVPSMEEDEEYEEQQRAQREARYEAAKNGMSDDEIPF